MSQIPGQMPNRHSPYEPFPWVFWVRIAQLAFTVLIIALSAYAASKSWAGWGLSVSWWTLIWTLLWVPASTWGVPRIPSNYRPNIIALVFECFTWFWWMLSFAGLALLAAATGVIDSFSYSGYKRTTTVTPGSSSTGSSSGSTYYTSTGTYSSSASQEAADILATWNSVSAVLKAATAFAAINWALFIATFIAICVKIHRQRKDRLLEIYQANGNPNVTVNHIHMHNTAPINDKQAEVHVTASQP